MPPVNAPKKAKGLSKKGKRGWRKNVDITQVEEYLDDKRLEERLGGSFADRPDDQLFTIDKDITEAQPEVNENNKWRKKRVEKPLKCFQHLEIQGGVGDPKKGRNRRKTPQEKRNPTVIAKEKALAAQGIVKAKVKLQKEHRQLEKLKKLSTQVERQTRRRTNFDFDLWGATQDADAEMKKVQNDDWLQHETINHTLKNTRQNARKVPQDLLDKTSDLKAVEEPHAGLSYNPSLQDHQELLWNAAVIEMRKEKAQRKIEYHTTRMIPTADKAPTKESIFKEMAEGIKDLDPDLDQDADEDVESSGEEETENKSFKPKTKKQKNREKRELYESNVKKAELEAKKKNQDIFKVKSMKKQIKVAEDIKAIKGKIKEAKKVAKRSLPAILGEAKFEEQEIPLKLSDELTGNLRSLKPEGNLLEDRFKSLQKRNVFEPRTKKKAPKPAPKRRKKVEKRSYKMGFDWENK